MIHFLPDLLHLITPLQIYNCLRELGHSARVSAKLSCNMTIWNFWQFLSSAQITAVDWWNTAGWVHRNAHAVVFGYGWGSWEIYDTLEIYSLSSGGTFNRKCLFSLLDLSSALQKHTHARTSMDYIKSCSE